MKSFVLIQIAIAVAFAVCFAVTTYIVAPLQGLLFPDITVFASLMFLPHGVRVLATWAYGWRAIPGLLIGSVIAGWMIIAPSNFAILEPQLVYGALIGAMSAYVSFELARLVGVNCYLNGGQRLNWRGLLAIGALSSLINSVGHTVNYSGVADLSSNFGLWATFKVGDMMGLIVCMLALMFAFRWARRQRKASSASSI